MICNCCSYSPTSFPEPFPFVAQTRREKVVGKGWLFSPHCQLHLHVTSRSASHLLDNTQPLNYLTLSHDLYLVRMFVALTYPFITLTLSFEATSCGHTIFLSQTVQLLCYVSGMCHMALLFNSSTPLILRVNKAWINR